MAWDSILSPGRVMRTMTSKGTGFGIIRRGPWHGSRRSEEILAKKVPSAQGQAEG